MAVDKYIKIVVFFLVLLTVALSAGCSKKEKVAGFVANGDRLMAAGDPVQAILEYKNALQIDIRNLEAVLGLAKAYIAQKDYQNGYRAYRSALEIAPDCDEARVQLAWLLALGNQGLMALDELSKLKSQELRQPGVDIIKARAFISLERFGDAGEVLSANPDADENKEIQALLALCYKKSKDRPSMMRAVEKWRQIDPKDPSSYVFLAQVAAEEGKSEGAAGELQKMIEADPSDSGRRLLRAQVFESLGMVQHAATAYEELGGEDPGVMMTKADFWTRQGNDEKARALLRAIVESNPAHVDAVVKLARIEIDRNDPDSASKLLEASLKERLSRTDRERLLVAKATLCARRGDRKAAVDICEEVLKEDQSSTDAHLLLGKILLTGGNPREAELHLAQAAAARAEDEEVQILLARCRILNRNDAMAVDTIVNALEINPKSSRLRMQLFLYKVDKKEFDQAARVLDKGIELKPDDISLLKARGEFYAAQKNWGKAEEDFRKIVKLRPDFPTGYIALGSLMLGRSRLEEAVSFFNEAREKENGWKSAIPALMAVYIQKGDKAKALAVARTEAEKRPNSARAHFYLGQACDMSGDFCGSEKSFSRAMELAPEWPAPFEGLAKIYVKQGKASDVIANLEKDSGKNAKPLILLQLATLYEHAGRNEDAIRVYESLLENGRVAPDILNNLAYLYAEHHTKENQLEKASQLVDRALAMQPRNPNFLDTAAWVAYKRGKLDAAWDYIEELQAYASEEGIYKLHAAIVLNDRGEKQQALAYLDKALQQKMDDKNQERAQKLKKQWMEASGK